jgi:hypothetical protein
MPVRIMVLTAGMAAGVSAVVAFTLGLLLAAALRDPPSVAAQVAATPTAAVGATAGPISSPGATPTVAPVVRAERFEVVDAQGALRAQIGMDRGDVGVLIMDPSSQPRALIGWARDCGCAVIQLNNPQGAGVTLRADPEGVVGLAVTDSPRQLRAILGLTSNGRPVLGFLDPSGLQRASLVLTEDGTPSMLFLDPQGPVVGVGMFPGAGAGLAVSDQAGGQQRAHIGVQGSGRADIVLRDEQGQLVWQAPQ